MAPLSDAKEAEIIQAFHLVSRQLDDLLNIDNPYFEGMVGQIYPSKLQLNKVNGKEVRIKIQITPTKDTRRKQND